jgi:dynein heavy chain 2
MKQFVCDLLGIKDISPETLNLRKLYTKETISTEPILIIISPGADPSAELRDLAMEITGKDRYSEVRKIYIEDFIVIRCESDIFDSSAET